MNLPRMVKTLPTPVNYFQGPSSALAGLPGNVLLFGRTAPFPGADCHHRHVLAVCLEGAATAVVDGVKHVVAPRQAFVVFPFQRHDYEGFSPGGISWLFATFDLREDRALQVLRGTAWPLDARALKLVEEMLRSFGAYREGDREASDLLVLRLAELLARLARAAAGRQTSAPGRRSGRSDRRSLIHEAMRYVHENIARPTSIRDVAEHLAISPSRLRVVFHEGTGMSLGKFMLRERTNRALALLGRTEMSVSEIAMACGYQSVRSFSRAFRARRKVSPSAFRAGRR
jgi:AraC-like DNA-binding protein